jgi:membrane protein
MALPDDDQQESHRDTAASGPTKLPRRTLPAVGRRVWREARSDGLTHWAAALTYYGILSIFPALLALVSVLGMIGSSATQPLIDNVTTVAPGPAKDIAIGALEELQSSGSEAGLTFALGLAAALWAASGYVGAFMQASNAIYDVEEGRPIWKTVPLRILITVVTLVLLAVVAVAVTVTGPLADRAGDLLGLGSAAVAVWDIAKWPVLILVVAFLFAILYWASPNVEHPGPRWVTPGGLIAVLLWIVASAGFALYVANFSSYNETYGSLGGVIVFLVWLWLSNLVLLVGAEINAELERQREIEHGHDPRHEPFLPPRDAASAASS